MPSKKKTNPPKKSEKEAKHTPSKQKTPPASPKSPKKTPKKTNKDLNNNNNNNNNDDVATKKKTDINNNNNNSAAAETSSHQSKKQPITKEPKKLKPATLSSHPIQSEVNPIWTEKKAKGNDERQALFKIKSLAELGYTFNNNKLETLEGEPFDFKGQTHYERLGDLVANEVQALMIEEPYGLIEKWIPSSPDPKQPEDHKGLKLDFPQVNIFMTPDALTNKAKLMILTCGTGMVQAGQWARSLCINDSLDSGSIFSYITFAKKQGYGLIVVNPNALHVVVQKKIDDEEDSESPSVTKKAKVETKKSSAKNQAAPEPEEVYVTRAVPKNVEPFQHMHYVYDNFISKAKAKHLVIVAHSFGGCVAAALCHDRPQILQKLCAIAFTDSVHSFNRHWTKPVKTFLATRAINWVRSAKPVDTQLQKRQGCGIRSAGTQIHEECSANVVKQVEKFFNDCVKMGPLKLE